MSRRPSLPATNEIFLMAAKAAALVLGRCQAGQTLQQAGPSRTLTLTLTLTLPNLTLTPT